MIESNKIIIFYRMELSSLFFLNISKDDPMHILLDQRNDNSASALAAIAAEAERLSLSGDVIASYFAYRLITDENAFGRAAEMRGVPNGSIGQIASGTLVAITRAIRDIRCLIKTDARFRCFAPLLSYTPCAKTSTAISQAEARCISSLGKALATSTDMDAISSSLANVYAEHGSGVFAFNAAFTWDEGLGLLPLSEKDPVRLSSLLGYDAQKEILLSNTARFVSGMHANNVLLFGDSGTGKSTSVRALLNEDDLTRKGLRMIEVRKDQFKDIQRITDMIRSRRYRFILFMDDLSFEEFETDYKYLKATIEGGLARKPENVLIYATSNRRNIVREVWADRKAEHDDVHGADTMQEKLSLADRFGLTIWYGTVGKSEFMEMVASMASEAGIEMPRDELEARAMRWEIEKGSFSGRTASQFIRSLEREHIDTRQNK